MAELYRSATEYLANAITIQRGSASDILTVGVYHTSDPSAIPEVEDFTQVTLVDGVSDPDNPLAVPGVIDVVSLVGPRGGDVVLTQGDYQRYVLVTTATEDIIRRVDTVTIL